MLLRGMKTNHSFLSPHTWMVSVGCNREKPHEADVATSLQPVSVFAG